MPYSYDDLWKFIDKVENEIWAIPSVKGIGVALHPYGKYYYIYIVVEFLEVPSRDIINNIRQIMTKNSVPNDAWDIRIPPPLEEYENI